jgi:phosphoserine phosphatase RsbU/P
VSPSPEDQIQELLLLQRVAQRINSILEVDRLLEQIVDDVAQTFGYTRSAVLLLDEDDPGDLVVAAARGWTRFHEPGLRLKVGKEGMVGRVALTGERLYAPDVRLDPHYVVSEEATRSEVDIPIRARDHIIGVFNAQSPEVDGFSPSRLRLLELLAGHVGIALANARLFERERREKDRLAKEVAAARAIQEGLFPAGPPEACGLTVTGRCLPSREVGGDWYDYIPLPDGRLGVVVADVSGKGMAAALLMSSTGQHPPSPRPGRPAARRGPGGPEPKALRGLYVVDPVGCNGDGFPHTVIVK